jgi:hypothetical protein
MVMYKKPSWTSLGMRLMSVWPERSAVWVFVRSHAAELNTLHRRRRGCTPLRLLRWRLRLRLLLLLLQRRQHIVGRGRRIAVLLCEYLRHLSVNMWVAGINPT